LRDVGGFQASLVGLAGNIFIPFSAFSFIIKAAEELFYVRQNKQIKRFSSIDYDESTRLFQESGLLTTAEKQETGMHSPLKFSFCRFVYICLAKYFFDYFRWCYTKSCKQYLKIYNSAEISIKKELDVIRVIKQIRNINITNGDVLN